MASFYANENFPLPVVVALRTLSHDVLTSQEAGNADRRVPDEEVLQYAIQDRRAVLTFNRRHFIKLHIQRPAHAGIVVCTYDPDFAELAKRIDAAVASDSALVGQLIRVNRPG
jgi:predicted nuclease of predicted toxin-antitoxin system